MVAAAKAVAGAVRAVAEAWYPGEEGGNALADVLTGACDPGGRRLRDLVRPAPDRPGKRDGFSWHYEAARFTGSSRDGWAAARARQPAWPSKTSGGSFLRAS